MGVSWEDGAELGVGHSYIHCYVLRKLPVDLEWRRTLGLLEEDTSNVVVTAGLICIREAGLFQTAQLIQRAFSTRRPWPVRTHSSPNLSHTSPCLVAVHSQAPAVILKCLASVLLTSLPPARPTTFRLAHTVFTRRVFVVWVFFLHKFAAASFETTNPEATQKESEKERKGERIKEGMTGRLSVNHVLHSQGLRGGLVLALPFLPGFS